MKKVIIIDGNPIKPVVVSLKGGVMGKLQENEKLLIKKLMKENNITLLNHPTTEGIEIRVIMPVLDGQDYNAFIVETNGKMYIWVSKLGAQADDIFVSKNKTYNTQTYIGWQRK